MDKKIIDMHMHTIYSDGEYEPQQLIEMAKIKKIDTISITDHNTVNGLKKIDFSKINGINVIPGIEITCKVDKGQFHLLGYNINYEDEKLNEKLKDLRTNSYYSMICSLNVLKLDYNILFDSNDISDLFNKKGNIGRPDLAKLLIKYRYVKTAREAFNKYLNDVNSKTRKFNRDILYNDAIDLIHGANGISVLAHPKQLLLNDDKLDDLIKNMKNNGLDGIEVYHSCHNQDDIDKYLYLAQKYELLISAGSDFHGKTLKPDVEMGVVNSNAKVKKLTILDKIKK